MHRLDSLIARDMAAVLWSTRAKMSMTIQLRASLGAIRALLADHGMCLSQPIGYIIKRDPHFVSLGDARKRLEFWFDLVWSPRVRSGLGKKPSDGAYVHINSLEFIVVVLQLAAVVVRLNTLPLARIACMFPMGVPAQPVLLCRTANTSAELWAN